ncbi:MAG: sugar ABC transporter permease [Clostridia bacterium]|nr:sugar ABC transporter permease [Clostridia bacterium]
MSTAVNARGIKTHRRPLLWHLRQDWQLWIMLLPSLVYIFIFCYMPMYGAQLAFRKYDFTKGIYGGDWMGLEYFKQYFSSSMFSTTLVNTLVISFCSIVFSFPAPIVLAIIINQLRAQKWKKTLQTTVYIPYFISTVVLVSMLNVLFAKNGGVLSDLLKTLHIVPEKANLLGQRQYFVWMYVGSGIWQSMGWNSIIYIAALSSVDVQLYDAAKIDGANVWQRVLHIEFPALVPTIMILLIMNMGNILNVGFDKIYLMQNTLNLKSSEVISTYVYSLMAPKTGAPQFSLATAVGLFTNVVNFIFLLLANAISKRVTGSGLM